MTSRPDPRRRSLEERRRHALRDLQELDQQVVDGEIDAETAARLASGYREELREAEEGLAALPPETRPAAARRSAATTKRRPAGAPEGASEETPTKALPVRGLAILGAVAVVLTVAIVIIGTSGDEETASGPATITPAPVDPNDLIAQMEAAVAVNPESNGMRLTLAGLYFERGDYLPAIEHYLAVIDNDPAPEDEALAISRVGWMAYVTDQPNVAVEYLRSATELDPANGEAKLFLGVVLLYGLDDAEAAIPLLEEVLTFPDLPETLRPEVEGMLEEARSMENDQ